QVQAQQRGPQWWDTAVPPRLDLGKKVSTTQDLMIEELSLPHNRGSRLFQQRQRRMQRFTFENLSSHREVGLRLSPREDAGGQQSYHSELHVAASPQGGPPEVPKKTEKVLQMSKILNPDALAPGYSGPLKEVPLEKFNVTAIPKGYRSPWHDLLGDKDNAVLGEYQPPMRPSQWDFRSFNRTPAPFDKTQLSDLFFVPAMELDNLSALEVIDHRRNFNRVPQGWVRILPESDEL
uniref:Myozenin 3 n=1 Tax=Amazona collaria TaxID=241587 RepID=A0A8B9FH06_9PSIT